MQVVPVHAAGVVESAIATVPLPAEAALTVTIGTKFAVSVWAAWTLVSVHVAVSAQVPPVQPVNAFPAAGVAVRVTVFPRWAAQLGWFVHAGVRAARDRRGAGPVPATAAAIVTGAEMIAVLSSSTAGAAKAQVLTAPFAAQAVPVELET